MLKKTILCVDDEKIVLDSLKAQLKRRFKEDFNYEIALDAEEAMEVIEELNEEDNIVIVIILTVFGKVSWIVLSNSSPFIPGII